MRSEVSEYSPVISGHRWPLRALLDTHRSVALLWAMILMLSIGYVDYLTTWELNLSVFYSIPILMMAWRGDLRMALLMAMLCGAVYFFANTGSHPYKTTSGYVWASINRLVYFVFVAIGGTALRKQREEMRARLEVSQRAQALEHEIVRVSEREQMRIGQDLHDGLCQDLAAINCAAACLKANLQAEARREAHAAEMIQRMLQDAVVEARNVARGISPVHANAEDLAVVLEELTATTNQKGQITTIFTESGAARKLDAQISLHLFRIAQEAVRNAVKHAQATRVEIELRQDANAVNLTIIDDGKGFLGTPSVSTGMGLGTMRYRARLIDAKLDVASRSGNGTTITCSLPLPSTGQGTPP